MTTEPKGSKKSLKTDTQTSSVVSVKPSTPIIKSNTIINDDGRQILKTSKPLDPIEPKTPILNTSINKDPLARVDEVIEIAKKVAESKPANFDLVFEMAMKVYIMTSFRSYNNLAIEVSA